MKQQGLSFFSDIDLVVFAMVLFLSVFIGMVIFVYSKSRKAHYEKVSRLPLDSNEQEALHVSRQ